VVKALSFDNSSMDLPLDPANWPGTPEWEAMREDRIRRHRAWVDQQINDYEDERCLRRPHN
jgi:hypothetical protein